MNGVNGVSAGSAVARLAARRATLAAAVAAAAAFVCTLHLFACSEDGTHIYTGRLYLEARDCLGTPSSVDVVDGNEPGTCAPTCLVQRRAEGGRVIYVSTMCAPYPFDFDTSGSDPRCPAALASFARNDTCFSDGGSSAPALDASAADAADAADASLKDAPLD